MAHLEGPGVPMLFVAGDVGYGALSERQRPQRMIGRHWPSDLNIHTVRN